MSSKDRYTKCLLQNRRPASDINEPKKPKFVERGLRFVKRREKDKETRVYTLERVRDQGVRVNDTTGRIREERPRVQIQIPSWRVEAGKGDDWRRMKGEIEDTSDKVKIYKLNTFSVQNSKKLVLEFLA